MGDWRSMGHAQRRRMGAPSVAAANAQSAGDTAPPTRLPHWGALQEGDVVVGLNGSTATNVQHHPPYSLPKSGTKGRGDSRPMTTFDYNHPTDPLWQGRKYRTPSQAPGPDVYRKRSK